MTRPGGPGSAGGGLGTRARWERAPYAVDTCASAIATTGLVTLATGSTDQMDLLSSRLVDTAVGLAVNLLVWPPLRDRAAWSYAEQLPVRLARLLGAMAHGAGDGLTTDETDEWVREIRRVDVHVDAA